jgi:hypothetical protein
MSLELHWTVVVVVLLVSGVSSAVLLRRSMARTCVACGHGPATHRAAGCDGLIGDSVPCGCESFVPPSSVPPSSPRRPVARSEQSRIDRQTRKAS